MGTASSSPVLTIHSPLPLEDSSVIREVFPEFRVANESDKEESVVLVHEDGSISVFLVFSRDLLPPSRTVWSVNDGATIEKAAANNASRVRLHATTGDDFVIGELKLKSGAAIILATSEAIGSDEGRRTLMRLLAPSPALPTDVPVENGSHILDSLGETSPEADYDLPRFPSLDVKLLRENNQTRDFPLNSRTPVDVETDLFKGKILFLLRPPNPPEDDPYWNERIFSQKKRRIIIQIQGKFKREPSGIVYAGAEVSEQMKLGLLTRGVCGVLLRLIEGFSSDVHYSYGDSKGEEKPHIVVPAHSFFERVVATPPSEHPPPIDEMFEESKESIARRKKFKGAGFWNKSDVFSLSFFSMYIDLPTWQLVGLPLQDLSLKVSILFP